MLPHHIQTVFTSINQTKESDNCKNKLNWLMFPDLVREK